MNKIATIVLAAWLTSTFFACTPKSAPIETPTPVVKSTPKITNTIVKQTPAPYTEEDRFFTDIFAKYPGRFDSILAGRRALNVQIIYTEINRDANNKPTLKHHYFNRNNASYFYPASTVKLPLTLLALEKLNQLNLPTVNKNATFITDAAYSGQTATYNDPNSVDGRPTIAQYIKQILLVSDNEAANRLYEFLGQDYINSTLAKKGYSSAQIIHRLGVSLSEDENRHTNPIRFLDNFGMITYDQPLKFNNKPYPKRSDSLGLKYYSGGKLYEGAMDFSKKNRLQLSELQTMLQAVIFPETINENSRFELTADDRNFLLKYMSQMPRESMYPSYDSSYKDSWSKFLFLGNQKENLPPNIRIFSKSGNAYGQLIDAAYVVDFEKGIEFMLCATIYCNSDGVLNDDKYDYATVGWPFLRNLGRAIYDYEVKRKRDRKPDLSEFRMVYDK